MLRDPFILAPVLWLSSATFPFAGRGESEETMAKQHSRGDPPPQAWKLCLASWGQASRFQTRSIIWALKGTQNLAVFLQPHCPLANLLLQLGYSHTQVLKEFQSFRRCSSWFQEVFFSSCQPPRLGSQHLPCVLKLHRPWHLPAASDLVSHLPSPLQMLRSWP